MRVFILDDHPIVRKGLAAMINAEEGFEVCGDTGECKGTKELIAETRPDLAIFDISLKDGDGIELMEELRQQGMKIPILVYSMFQDPVNSGRAFRAGASGYVTKREIPELLIIALRHILEGGTFVSREVAAIMAGSLQDARFDPVTNSLSRRELEVFRQIGAGFSTAKIAEKLHISPKTVETYRARIKAKLRIDRGSGLVRYAIKYIQDKTE